MTTPIVIIGCGGFGREVHDVIDAINQTSCSWALLGYLDDRPDPANRRLVEERGSRLLGPTEWVLGKGHEIQYVIGIGNGTTRGLIDMKLTESGLRSATLIHPAATLGFDVRIGAGSIICAGARLTTNISLGRHVHLNLNTTVGHDTDLGDYATVNPMVAISGSVRIEREATLGTHSAVLQGLTIGRSAFVGAGACVVRNVAANAIVKGVPAR